MNDNKSIDIVKQILFKYIKTNHHTTMMIFYKHRETSDETVYMFIRPYIFLLVVLGPIFIFPFFIFISPWVALCFDFAALFLFLIFVIEFWSILRKIRRAKKQGYTVRFSGKFFSYFNPWTYTITKKE